MRKKMKCNIQKEGHKKIHMILRSLRQSFFCEDLKKIDAKSPERRAAVMPAEEDESPPERMPIAPFSSIASFTPRAIFAPKPMRGSETPEPNVSSRGVKMPTP